ncbi:MAG: tetratricopeptide repeat protein [Planctomycetota bacterium]|jgi:tetratricopeptide (TPR) repeat protein
MSKATHKNWSILISIFLVLAVLAVYWPVSRYEFLKYDDDKYVTENRNVTSGLNWQNIRWAFTTGHASNWHPLTWLSHMLDCEVFEMEAGAHHFTNVLLHAANTVLLFVVLARMTGGLWASGFVAAVFGLHPLHIESVAWVAERKDVLSTFFWLLTMWAYVRYAEKPKVVWYLLALALFALGLMAKPMLVTLPFVLLLLDYWPLERLQLRKLPGGLDAQERETRSNKRRTPILYLVLEKVPFLVLTVVSSCVTFFVQRKGGAMPGMEMLGLRSRVENAIVSYVAYIVKMIWPSRLGVLYPRPAGGLSTTNVVVCGAVLLLVTICFILLIRWRKYPAAGWFWYVGTLVPVIGLIQVGVQARADRYTYVPLTGLFIIIAWGIPELFGKWRYRKPLLGLLAGAVLAAMIAATSVQLRYWKNSIALFGHTLDVTKNNWIMHGNYAGVLREAGDVDGAMEQLDKALKLKPDSAEVRCNVGNALSDMDRLDDAIQQYRHAIRLDKNFAEGHYNLAVALAKKELIDEAIAEYREAWRLNKRNLDALNNMAYLLDNKKGQFEEAINLYEKAIALEPGNIIAHGRLGLALAKAKRFDEAIEQFHIVLKAWPNDVEMYCNVGLLLERQNKTSKAITYYRKALEIKPDNARARKYLELALKKQKKAAGR